MKCQQDNVDDGNDSNDSKKNVWLSVITCYIGSLSQRRKEKKTRSKSSMEWKPVKRKGKREKEDGKHNSPMQAHIIAI